MPALTHPSPPIRLGALRAVLERACLPGQKWAVENLHTFGESGRTIVRDYRGTMTFALRDAVLAADHQTCKNGCDLTLEFREYELFPALINASEDETNANRALTAHTLLQLAEHLYDELAAPRNPNARRNPQKVRDNVVAALELSIQRFHRHRVPAVLEAFLMLASRDNPTLKANPCRPAECQLPAVGRHAHAQPPRRHHPSGAELPRRSPGASAAMTLLAYRHDAPFIDALLRKVGTEPAPVIATNLRRLENISWLQSEELLLTHLDDAAQRIAVEIAVRSGVNRRAVFKLLEMVLDRGKPTGRCAAAEALSQFNGAEANSLAIRALLDPDPQVQAHILPQLRNRGIPGAVSKLIELLDSPHAVVKRRRTRQSGRVLLRTLCGRLRSPRRRRPPQHRRHGRQGRSHGTGRPGRRAHVTVAQPPPPRDFNGRSRWASSPASNTRFTMHCSTRIISSAPKLLARLSHCDTPDTHTVLREALTDRSLVVREAAEASLQELQSGSRRHRPPPASAPLASGGHYMTSSFRIIVPHSSFLMLFADRGALLRDMGSGFRGDRARVDATEVAMVIAATIAAVVVFWLLARFASFREGRGSSNNPKLLFRQLCQAHGLSRTQRSLLQQIGERAEVAPVPAIFLRPELVEAALIDPQFEPFRGDLAALRRRLFAAT